MRAVRSSKENLTERAVLFRFPTPVLSGSGRRVSSQPCLLCKHIRQSTSNGCGKIKKDFGGGQDFFSLAKTEVPSE